VGAGLEEETRRAAQAAAEIVEDGMTVGLGAGTTAVYLLLALVAQVLPLRCVVTWPRTKRAAAKLGLRVGPFTADRLDIMIDGADQVSSEESPVKGGGAAHTREKLVAVTAERFVVIAHSTKLVPALHPIPLELLAIGLESILARLGTVRLRDAPPGPDGGLIAAFTGDVGAPGTLPARLEATPGVVEHGLFSPEMVSVIFVGRGESVEPLDRASS
jgi:ribose 5-phosphate isomerase A